MFEQSFLAGLRSVSDGELPMRCDMCYINCVLPRRPRGVTLDLKRSGFRKQQKLFSLFEKEKVITTKLIHKQENVVAVDRTHALYVAHCAVEDETAREDGRFEANHAQRQSKARAPGGKSTFVTYVCGLEDFAIEPETFAQTAQRKFSASTSVSKLPGKNEVGVEIGIQGNVLRELLTVLKRDWGIPGKFLEVEDKT